MPASLFCNCMRCCRSSATHAFSPPEDFRTCRNAPTCATSNAAITMVTERSAMILFAVVCGDTNARHYVRLR